MNLVFSFPILLFHIKNVEFSLVYLQYMHYVLTTLIYKKNPDIGWVLIFIQCVGVSSCNDGLGPVTWLWGSGPRPVASNSFNRCLKISCIAADRILNSFHRVI